MSRNDILLEIHAGAHERNYCPIQLGQLEAPYGSELHLHSSKGEIIVAQTLRDGTAVAILPHIGATETGRYALSKTSVTGQAASLRTEDNGIDTLTVYENDCLITSYRYNNVEARPYFFPVNEPGGVCVTRSYPMQTIAHETADHPHHRSIWIAHGDVNGVDNWSEEPGHGYTAHQAVNWIENGPVATQFNTTGLWTDVSGNPLLTQDLTTTFWRSDGVTRIIDFNITLTADQEVADVEFGDTKEGGILAVRVASAMDVTRGGVIRNVYGGIDEGECWGKNSHYCCYSGTVENTSCGISIFDHPDGFRSPTTWHVRNYGLMTANPFGYSAFTHGRVNGTFILDQGNSLQFKYRMIVHRDPQFHLKAAQSYLNYAFPPRVHMHAGA